MELVASFLSINRHKKSQEREIELQRRAVIVVATSAAT
jgi:hypothetical protein